MAYNLMKRIIERDKKAGTLDVEAIMEKLDAFLAADRLTATQYQELVALMHQVSAMIKMEILALSHGMKSQMKIKRRL